MKKRIRIKTDSVYATDKPQLSSEQNKGFHQWPSQKSRFISNMEVTPAVDKFNIFSLLDSGDTMNTTIWDEINVSTYIFMLNTWRQFTELE